jgi:SAM-dependent methyltransferase
MASSWSERGAAAVDAGDLDAAKGHFSRAVKAEGGNAAHRVHLSIVLEGLGELDASAQHLTHALRLDPRRQDAARRLAVLLRRAGDGAFDHVELNAIGLRHGLSHDRVDRQAIANFAMRYLAARSPLKDALAAGRARGWPEAARGLCLASSSPLLRDELFLELLRTSVLSNPELEMLLTAVRRVLLLELPAKRFADRALMGFAIALLEQCWSNDFVWFAGEEETQRLAEEVIRPDRLTAGDREEGQRFLRICLYQPPAKATGGTIDPDAAAGIEPAALREAITRRLARERDERDRASRIPQLGTIVDETSCKVARFYEESLYPRWASVIVQRDHLAVLANFLGRDRSTFLRQPFEALIAGCGTGQQAVQAALHYGESARILAVDLSAPSLGYASRMADAFGVRNVEFARADLAQMTNFGPEFVSRFQVVEAVGVLHHMADPFAAWSGLLKCLAPGGFMRLGLYSAIARRNLATLRSELIYPGPGCDDAALRAFRYALLTRQDEQARDARKFMDFWDTGSFRDMLLHVNEHNLSLGEIGRFLKEERLVFRGFQLAKESQANFWRRFPLETWPGRLESWATFEEENPFLFDNMYLFWCEKPAAN